jgi:hypothetical protein
MKDSRYHAHRGRWTPRRGVTFDTFLSRVVCVILVVMQLGCRSVYRLHCTSSPSPAGVLAGEQMLGETECTIDIPKDSEWIQDGRIELTFCLPDGPEKTHVVDLHGMRPSNPLAEIVAAPLVVAGFGLVFLCGGDDEDDDEHEHFFTKSHRKKKDDNDPGMQLLGVGVAGVGMGLYHLLGGDTDSLTPYDVHVDFNEPAEGDPPH